MSRAADGTCTLPANTVRPAVTNTTISATDFNAAMADVESMLTDSLSRSGKGGMATPMQFAGGDATTPGITFVGDTDTGVFSDIANNVGIATGGTMRVRVTDTSVAITDAVAVTGDVAVTGNLSVTGTITGVGSGATGTGSMAAGLNTITSITYVSIPGGGLHAHITCVRGGKVIVSIQNAGANSGIGYIRAIADAGGNRQLSLRLYMDGTTVLDERGFELNASEVANLVGLTYVGTIGDGAHTIELEGKVSNASASLLFQNLNITIYEL
jgi:hypothetical protein